MAVSSVNQVRQLYVINNLITDEETALAKAGDAKIKATSDFEKEVYFEVMGRDTVLRSDRIPVKNINYVKAVKAASMKTPLKKVKVVLKDNPIAGQDYILRINLRQFYGMSDEDQYFKDAAVHVTKAMAADGQAKQKFYAEMKDALDRCFSRELGATIKDNPYLTFTAKADSLEIEEKEQHWTPGVETKERVYFDVVPTTVYDGVEDIIWGETTVEASTNFIGNGTKIADLEYFLLGERGDQYRKIGFPNDIETLGVVDPEKSYDVMEIHYAFTDTGVNSYRTEKDITLVFPSEGEATFTKSNAFVDEFNKATGLSVDHFDADKEKKQNVAGSTTTTTPSDKK